MRIDRMNPILESLTYYKYKACGKQICEGIQQYSDTSAELWNEFNQAFSPIAHLETMLDENLAPLPVGKKRLFKPIDESLGLRGFSFAEIVFMNLTHAPYVSFEAAQSEVLSYTEQERRELILASLVRNDKFRSISEDTCDGFLRIIEEQHISDAEKWSLVSLYTNFEAIAKDTFALIHPAIALLERNAESYQEILDQFTERYANIDCNFGKYLTEHYDIDVPTYDDCTLTPWLFGYGDIQSAYSANDPPKTYTNMGVLVDFIATKIKKRFATANCDDLLKVLSDPNRAGILVYLRDKRAYGLELAEYLHLAPNTVSHHISKLLSVGLISSETEGSRVYYQANKQNIRRFLSLLEERFVGQQNDALS